VKTLAERLDIGVTRRRRRNDERLPVGHTLDLVALDFETANSSRSSICAIGVVAVRDGAIVLDSSILIDPECEFDAYNSAVNGIDAEDVIGAPTLPEVWPLLSQLLDGSNMCAHSATFDIGVLRASAARYGLVGPTLQGYCTWRIAKRVWPDLASHGLAMVAKHLGIEFDHHDAGEDAVACALIALAAQRQMNVRTLPELAALIEYRPAVLTPDAYQPLCLVGLPPLAAMRGDVNADPTHPLYGKTLCFTGGMFSMVRREAAERVTTVGANFKDNMSAKVDYLVIGDADYVAFADGWKTGKLARAIELKEDGALVEILAERDFVALLNS
jgi:DNA polymerase-3 subunit epsilon